MIDYVPGKAPYCARGRDDISVPLDAIWDKYQGNGAPPNPTVRSLQVHGEVRPELSRGHADEPQNRGNDNAANQGGGTCEFHAASGKLICRGKHVLNVRLKQCIPRINKATAKVLYAFDPHIGHKLHAKCTGKNAVVVSFECTNAAPGYRRNRRTYFAGPNSLESQFPWVEIMEKVEHATFGGNFKPNRGRLTIGTSNGGVIAAKVFAKYPQYYKTAVLLDPALPMGRTLHGRDVGQLLKNKIQHGDFRGRHMYVYAKKKNGRAVHDNITKAAETFVPLVSGLNGLSVHSNLKVKGSHTSMVGNAFRFADAMHWGEVPDSSAPQTNESEE